MGVILEDVARRVDCFVGVEVEFWRVFGLLLANEVDLQVMVLPPHQMILFDDT